MVQVSTLPTKVALALLFSRVKVTRVPSGAFPNVPVPVSCWTVAVMTCSSLTSLVAVSGLTVMYAST